MPRILLAEDNPADVYLIREALHEHGVDAALEVAADGRDVISMVDGETLKDPGQLRLIILDLNLPRHDGIEILERLRSSAALSHIPVVVMTSSDSPQDRLIAMNLGARRYLRKPSNLEQFLDLGAVFKELLAQEPAARGAHNED